MIFLLIFTFADKLYSTGDYYRAITEYKREFFLNPDKPDVAEKIADAYYHLGDSRSAMFWYGKSLFLKESRRVKKKYVYLLAKNLRFEDLKILLERKDDPIMKAMKEFKSPTRLSYISYILPGGTQIVCGEFTSGILSMLWNGLSIYLGYKSLKERDILGVAFSLSLLQRFYLGNLQSARNAVLRKKLKRYNKTIEKYRPTSM